MPAATAAATVTLQHTPRTTGFDRNLVDFLVYKTPLKEAQGLGKLLLFEMMDMMRRPLLFEVTVPPPFRHGLPAGARRHNVFGSWQFPCYQARRRWRFIIIV